jgi:hypothetical protein
MIMRRQNPDPNKSDRGRMVTGAISAGLLCLLAGAAPLAQAGDDSISGFDQITLAPGDTGTCDSSPCTVYLKMPEGEGNYEVESSSDGFVGSYPAGETVKLGSFWSSQAFTIKGMDVPKAYAYIGDDL